MNPVLPFLSQRRLVVASLAASLSSPWTWAQQAYRKPRVVGMYTVPFEQQWVSRVHQALLHAADKGLITYRGLENVTPNEYEKALQTQAREGADIIFGEAFEVEGGVRQVARQFPSINFVMGSSSKPQAPNLSVYDNFIHEPCYLAGMLAGGITKTGKIGLIGGYLIPELNRLMNAFMEGAREVNPTLTFMTGEIRSWLNQPRARRITLKMLESGVDTLFAGTMAGVVETAAEQDHVRVFGNIIHPQLEYPTTVVASALWDLTPTVNAVLRDHSTQRIFANDYWQHSLMRNRGSSLSTLGRFERSLPKALLNQVRAREHDILSGKFTVKINDQPAKALRIHVG